MSIPLITLAVLGLMFLFAVLRPVNIGAIALVSTFMIGTFVLGESVEELLDGFPASLFVMLVGITYLFAVAQRNGTIDWAITTASAAGGGSRMLMPWIIFAITAAATGMGGVAPAIIAMMMPIAMTVAAAYHIRPILMGLMVCLGSTAGSFSPLGIFGITVNGVLDTNHLTSHPAALFAITAAASTAVAAGWYVANIRKIDGATLAPATHSRGGTSAMPRTPADRSVSHGESGGTGASGGASVPAGTTTVTAPAPSVTVSPTEPRPTSRVQRWTTVAGFLALPIGAVLFGLDAGFLALTVAVLLTLLFPTTAKAAVNDVSWGVVLLVAGVVTYVGMMQRNGTIDWVSVHVVSLPSITLAALLVCLTGAVVSAFASTTGILGALIPLAVPLIGSGGVSSLGLIVALSLSSSLVDFSPFSGGGAMLVANAPAAQREHIYRQVLVFCGATIIGAPLISWLIFILPW